MATSPSSPEVQISSTIYPGAGFSGGGLSDVPGDDPLSRLHPDPAGHLERESRPAQKCGLCVKIKQRRFVLDTESDVRMRQEEKNLPDFFFRTLSKMLFVSCE